MWAAPSEHGAGRQEPIPALAHAGRAAGEATTATLLPLPKHCYLCQTSSSGAGSAVEHRWCVLLLPTQQLHEDAFVLVHPLPKLLRPAWLQA